MQDTGSQLNLSIQLGVKMSVAFIIYRDEMMKILTEQNQLIHKLTCKFEN